jgi:hypothetical protein
MSQFNFEAEPFGEFTSEQEGAEELEQRVRDHRSAPRKQVRAAPRAPGRQRPWAPFVVGRPSVGRPVLARPFVAGFGFGRVPRVVGGGGFWRGLGLNRGYGYHRYHHRLPLGAPGRGWGVGPVPAVVETGASEWIVRLQASLATLVGDWVPQSGVLDVETRRALGMFQKQQQLPITGAPDEATLSALEAASASPGPGPEPAAAQEFESEEGEQGEARRRLARASDFLPDVFAREMDEVDQEGLIDGMKRFRAKGSKSTLLSLQIPEAPYSAEMFTSVQQLLDVFGAVDLALEIFAVDLVPILGAGGGLALTVGAPILALIGNFLALGAPYAEARAEHAKQRVRWGFALGVALGAGARKWSYVKQRHWQRRPRKNPMDEEMGPIGQKAFNLGLSTGYVQGRKLSAVQRKFLFDSIGAKFTSGDVTQFSGKDLTDRGWDDFYYRCAGVFLTSYVKN